MNLDYLQKPLFWVAFSITVIVALFLYGLNLDTNKSKLQKTKELLIIANTSINEKNDTLNSKNKEIKNLSNKVSSLNNKILEKDKTVQSLINDKKDLENTIIELENKPPEIITKYKTEYKEKKTYYTYGKGKGKLTIYKTCSNCPNFKVWVDNKYKGEISSYYENNAPSCSESSGTISFIITAGYHKIKCEDKKGSTWNIDVTVKENECYRQGFR